MKPKQFSECPKCGGTLIGGDLEIDCGDIWRVVTCEKCEWEYNEVYQFAFNETAGDCIPLDNKGKETHWKCVKCRELEEAD